MKAFLLLSVSVVSSLLWSVDVITLSDKSIANWEVEQSFCRELEEVSAYVFDTLYYEDVVYLVDTKSPAIRIMSLTGELLKSFDRKGKGPGELIRPSYIWLDKADNSICLYDDGDLQIKRYTTDLTFRSQQRLEYNYIPTCIYYMNNNEIKHFSSVEFSDKGMIFAHNVSLVHDDQEKVLYSTDFHMFIKGWYKHEQPLISVLDNKLAIGYYSRQRFEIDIFDENGNLTQKFTAPVKPLPLEKNDFKDKEEYAKKAMNNMPNLKIDKSIYGYHPVFLSLTATDDNLLWALCRDNQGCFFRVIDGKKQIAQLRLTEQNPTFPHLKGDYLYLIDGNEDDGYTFVSYKIVR